jgi:hypothetical protein
MDLDLLVAELLEVRDLVEVSQSDHPEDYNLDEVHKKLTGILEEVE